MHFVCKRLQLFEVFDIKRIGAADRQGNTVHGQRIMLAYFIQVVARFATGNHVVFGQHFKPVNRGFVLQDMFKMRDAQSESKTKGRVAHQKKYSA